MKILHTADWHLGAKTEGISRIEEQRRVLKEMESIANEQQVDIVLICGDIFDQAVPTSDAEDLFYETIEKLSNNNDRVVVVIAGNHDDPKRLVAGGHFAKKHNIVLAGNLNTIAQKGDFGRVRVSEVDKGFVEIVVKTNRGEEKCVVALLPYPATYRYEEKPSGETYSDNVKSWARISAKGFKRDSLNILAGHLMVVGASHFVGDDEKVLKVGDINVVSRADLPKADYYALGHIHSFQNIKGDMVYSGAPMMFDFKQKTAGVAIITALKGSVKSVEFKPISKASHMAEVEIKGIEEASKVLAKYKDTDIVNVTIIQKTPLSMMDIKNLKQQFPCVSQVRLRLKNIEKDDNNIICDRRSLDAESLFKSFYKSKRGAEPTRETVGLFKDLMEDSTSETN